MPIFRSDGEQLAPLRRITPGPDLYEREIEELIVQATSAHRVFVFDHTHRADSSSMRAQQDSREPGEIALVICQR